MKSNTMMDWMNKHITPFANKLANQRHLAAIRDTFMTILPITLFGSIFVILGAAPPVTKNSNGFLLAWASFAKQNALALTWLSTVSMSAMSIFICVGITYFLCKHYKENPLSPIMFSLVGFFMLVFDPKKLDFTGNVADISYWDGRGIIMALLISILTTEAYHAMRKHDFGRIKMPEGVPSALSESFASFVPALVIMGIDAAFFIIFHLNHTTAVKAMYSLLSPSFKVADSLPITILLTILVHLFWFFGVHDAALAGILGPIRDGNLSINAAAKLAGHELPRIFTTPFWVYFVIIGGCGSVLSLAILMSFSKSKQLKTVGRVGLVPAFFGISEPMIFGTPLMLNPIFFIPFIFTSVANATISYLCMSLGIVKKTFALFSWQMPAPIGAFLSTMDWRATVLVLALILLDAILYYPFMKVYEQNLLKEEQAE
ncbi:PTS transporter subunit EIIC [Lactobacillus sp. ESL0791]|uniref:PTS sugar transporter subunit IIC n=1 Tax=Lactobacillus sp. ESL0791 TaxID=2983234 RepID=UPI0023F749F5|nr:PTS transporter subunit EIIC [Lactobacillus sp. ESL0791]MDF7639507.1 PTS transporter subunit EIIC [Lactobacillus sp. ESL0791]